MKLSKTQQRILAARQDAERIRVALCWTEDAGGPDIPPPEGYGDELTRGYVFNAYTDRVDVACSSGGAHAIGRTDKTTSQRPIPLYSTRRRALLALRNAVEQECAERLARIDAQIEAERARD
jgi:hypothetical protein